MMTFAIRWKAVGTERDVYRLASPSSWTSVTAQALIFIGLLLNQVGATSARTTASNFALMEKVRPSIFEVVEAKVHHNVIKYDSRLPLNRIPIKVRTDNFHSIGTAFFIGNNRYITAAHVLLAGLDGLWGDPELRGYRGHVYKIGKIYKFSMRNDIVVFSLTDGPMNRLPLRPGKSPSDGQRVFAIGDGFENKITARPGSYVSTTLGPLLGKWLRFSSPVFHGDSGGPVLNQYGNVIGVILYKSTNGTPNYALPIDRVKDISMDEAEISVRSTYRFPLFKAQVSGLFKPTITLPENIDIFYTKYELSLRSYWSNQLSKLFLKNRSSIFPRGSGSNKILYGPAWTKSLPSMVIRNEMDVWVHEVHPHIKQALPGNGFLEMGNVGDNILFRIKKSQNITDDIFFHEPEKVMDTLLQPGTVWRVVAGQKIKVISLGRPSDMSMFLDSFHREWQIWTWPVTFSNSRIIVFALPVPDGYVGFFRALQAQRKYNFMINMKAMTKFFCAAYNGTLSQWKSFLGNRDLLPYSLRHLRVRVAGDGSLDYSSPQISFMVTPREMTIGRKSDLKLGFGYDVGGRGKLNVAYVFLQSADGRDSIRVERHIDPRVLPKSSSNGRWPYYCRHGQIGRVSTSIDGVIDVSGVRMADGLGGSDHGEPSAICYMVTVKAPAGDPVTSRLAQFESGLHAH